MTTTVRVKNFQSIREAEIEVDRLTVVTGTNNSGKTALQRAVRGVFQNTGGTAFIREGETKCSVEVDFGKDGKVRWEKGTGKRDRPTYVINDGEPIYPGSSVPDEVAAFGVVPIQAGGQDVWPTIAEQFTGQVFLLDRPGSALAEAVADVERVGQLNRALRSSESDRRQAAATLKVRQTDLAKQEAAVAAFDGLDEALAAVEALEAERTKVAKVSRALGRLTDLRDRLAKAKDDEAELAPVADIELPDPAYAKNLLAELKALVVLRDRLAAAKAEEAKYAGIEGVQVEGNEEPAERLLQALDVLKALQGRLNKATAAVVVQEAEVEQAEQDLVEAEAASAAALVELGTCPTCGTEMRQEAAEGDAP
jgi:ABC-type cobalamin/Fe3+-siderophores transport system ATPase subunit